MTFGSIKKFLKIAKYISNSTFTTSSNFVPYDVMQNVLKTGKAVNPILTFYYGLINFLKNPPLFAIISLLIGLILLIYLLFSISSL